MSDNVKIIGQPWFNEVDYDAIRSLFKHAFSLPSTYEQWKFEAERTRDKYSNHGYLVFRAYINPRAFPLWCAFKGVSISAQSSLDYAMTEAERLMKSATTYH